MTTPIQPPPLPGQEQTTDPFGPNYHYSSPVLDHWRSLFANTPLPGEGLAVGQQYHSRLENQWRSDMSPPGQWYASPAVRAWRSGGSPFGTVMSRLGELMPPMTPPWTKMPSIASRVNALNSPPPSAGGNPFTS